MEYNRIIAVTGLPGLFELVASKTDGAIVRSLDDQTTKFVSSRKHNFSHLESIEIYTKRDNINLVEIFKAMKTMGGELPDSKDANGLKAYFEKTYPDMDFERVYASDMKKMVKWFEIIDKNNIEFILPEADSRPEEVEVPASSETTVKPKKEDKATKAESASKEEETAEEKPKAKKKAAPKKAAESSSDLTEEATEEKPKKAARKKKSEE